MMFSRWRIVFWGLLLTLPTLAFSQTKAIKPPPLTLGKLAAPPKLDGVMNAGEWEGASKATLDVQIEPGDNIAASEKTEVWLAADRETLFIAFRAHDSDPSAICARVSKRDDINEDDLVALLLDTFNDRQRALRFTFNPLGIQQDGVFTEQAVDESRDAQYESKGQLVKDGYIVEAAIPFKSFRFKAGSGAKWGLHLRRVIPRTGNRFFNQKILRNRTTWQFNPYHSLRGIFDYDTAQRQFGASLLYAQVPRPNTTFYLGWNDLLFNGYDPLLEERRRGVGLVQQRRTFFVKLSYNFRR